MEQCKLCARWQPRCLSTQNKNWHSEVALSYLSGENKKKMSPGVASGRLWHNCTISILKQNKFKSSGNAQLFWEKKKVCHSAGKFGASVFWNAGIIHIEFMPQGTITEMNTCCYMLWCLHQAIHRKRIRHLSRCVILDNAMPHST